MMNLEDSNFNKYVGPDYIHDAVVRRIEESGSRVNVFLRTNDGKLFSVEFLDVSTFSAIDAEGMIVYALAEMEDKPPIKRFVFVNWEEGDDSTVEILAQDFRINEET